MDSVIGPGATYPAKRVETIDHWVKGMETFTIHEYRADNMVLSLRRVYPCIMVGVIGEDLIWESVRAEFLEFWDNLYRWDTP